MQDCDRCFHKSPAGCTSSTCCCYRKCVGPSVTQERGASSNCGCRDSDRTHTSGGAGKPGVPKCHGDWGGWYIAQSTVKWQICWMVCWMKSVALCCIAGTGYWCHRVSETHSHAEVAGEPERHAGTVWDVPCSEGCKDIVVSAVAIKGWDRRLVQLSVVLLPPDADVGWVKAAARSLHGQHGRSSAVGCRTCIRLPSMGQEGTGGPQAPYCLCVLAFLLFAVPDY